ncbi:MAG: glucosamine-6-phosphate isomerase [Fidelibacterota bacterium]
MSGRPAPMTRIPYIVVNNFPQLGFLTALRFLEWVTENPEGVISLPTGKTPEYFIKWVQYLLSEWDNPRLAELRESSGFHSGNKPELSSLRFVQIDEFYPINPEQHNSFYNYDQRFYIRGFGLDATKALLIDCDELPTPAGYSLLDIFPDHHVDLSLRVRTPRNSLEEIQQETIFLVDQWCSEYESRIQDLGGIGFFLGGIGPDGHIAFNVKGSDVHSTTRLTETNFETQAAAATDLGGIEISRNRLVITIGLQTITANPDATAIIIAAGEAKAPIVKNALEHPLQNKYPGSVLQRLENGRFYLTGGAATALTDSRSLEVNTAPWSRKMIEKVFIQVCQDLHSFGTKLNPEQLRSHPVGQKIPDISPTVIDSILTSFREKIALGIKPYSNETFLHTGPHHDDIMLGYLPHVIHLVRSPDNQNIFVNMTSGFTSVTNHYVKKILEKTVSFIRTGQIQMMRYPNFFTTGYGKKQDKDVYHYLDRIASKNFEGQLRGLCHRLVRAVVDIYGTRTIEETENQITEVINYLDRCYDGEKNTPDVQRLKGMIREFEEELVWAHYGVQVKDVHHLRLGFYTGDIFTENPQKQRDVSPVLDLLREVNPTVITLAMDPEGSGPDTHYKVLQTIAEALRSWQKEKDLSQVKIWGYRNVWYRFDPSEADIIVPVSLNSMSVMRDTFMSCYLSQKDASYPSYELDGPFCDLTQKIWVEQHQLMELILGRDFWYRNEHPRLRAAHGVIFIRQLTVAEFLDTAQRLEKSMEGQITPG